MATKLQKMKLHIGLDMKDGVIGVHSPLPGPQSFVRIKVLSMRDGYPQVDLVVKFTRAVCILSLISNG